MTRQQGPELDDHSTPVPDDAVEPTPRDARRPNRRPLVVAAVAVTAAVVAATVLVATRDGTRDDTSSTQAGAATSTETSAETTSPSTTADSTTATTAGTTQPAPSSAQAALAGFFTAAVTLDTRLHDAATAINGAGPPWPTVTEGRATRIQVPAEVVAKVQAAELAPVAEAIPAGVPRELLQPVILVYSDLSSRRHAMDDFSGVQGPATEGGEDAVEYMQRQALERLGMGSAAADRFDDDLEAARSVAASTPSFTTPPPDSRQAAERALLIDYVEGANTACGGTGGAIVTELPAIEWAGGTRDGVPVDGTIGGRGFTAELGAGGSWTTTIMFC